MINQIKIVFSLIFVINVVGCGGGGGEKSSNNETSYKKIVGDWITGCENYQVGKSRVRSVIYPEKKDDNTQVFILATALYNTSNCSGTGSIFVFGGPINYRGKFTTSICVAEKTDVNLVYGRINDIEITGNELQQLFVNAGLVNPSSNIACIYNDKLLLGLFTRTLNGSSDATRPVEMNTSTTFHHWDRKATKARRTDNDKLQILYSDFKKIIR